MLRTPTCAERVGRSSSLHLPRHPRVARRAARGPRCVLRGLHHRVQGPARPPRDRTRMVVPSRLRRRRAADREDACCRAVAGEPARGARLSSGGRAARCAGHLRHDRDEGRGVPPRVPRRAGSGRGGRAGRVDLRIDGVVLAGVSRLGGLAGAPAPDLDHPPRLEPTLVALLFDEGKVRRSWVSLIACAGYGTPSSLRRIGVSGATWASIRARTRVRW